MIIEEICKRGAVSNGEKTRKRERNPMGIVRKDRYEITNSRVQISLSGSFKM